MTYRRISTMGIFATAGIAALMIMFSQSDTPEPGAATTLSAAIDALPPSGAGRAELPAPAPPAYLGGTRATGRVAEVYVKVADNVFLALDQAPRHLQESGERWVDVQFPELLAGDVDSARAMLNRGEAGVEVGDVVEIKFAHKNNPRFFPVKELTRVTQFVAKKDQLLAQEYERRIVARTQGGKAAPAWLLQARAARGEAVTTAAR